MDCTELCNKAPQLLLAAAQLIMTATGRQRSSAPLCLQARSIIIIIIIITIIIIIV
jgi:hypothetical protein